MVATILMMVLLVVMGVGLLGLSVIELRKSSRAMAAVEARANARLALTLALGALQRELGPDRRISMEAAMFDESPETPAIDGISQARWMGSYDAWGTWLNAPYRHPETGSRLEIGQTYTPRRESMFRRWLVSLPPGEADRIGSIDSGMTSESVVLVGPGSLGPDAPAHDLTRGGLLRIADSAGGYAWWIGPENHRAKATLAAPEAREDPGLAETAAGDTPMVDVGSLEGLEALEGKPGLAEKLVSQATLDVAGVDPEAGARHFFDLTVHSLGIPASVRTGTLKRDLSLLLEREELPDDYAYSPGDLYEPSIRPVSSELRGFRPVVNSRAFASWGNMHRFFRMYRDSPSYGHPPLDWTDTMAATVRDGDRWQEEVGARSPERYARIPLLAKFTILYSTKTTPAGDGTYHCDLVYSPVFTLWNPYNVEMRFPPGEAYDAFTRAYKILPMAYTSYRGVTPVETWRKIDQFHANTGGNEGQDFGARFDFGSGEAVLAPGELRIFSFRKGSSKSALYEGFDPQGIDGIQYRILSNVRREDNPGIRLRFDYPYSDDGNIWFGNTPGSLNLWFNYDGEHSPYMYPHDWLNRDESLSEVTSPRPDGIARWIFDNQPNLFAHVSLTVKSASRVEYESIDWARDWRGRNWIHSPAYYFGSALYISENERIANTQRLDHPYQFHFGPASVAELPKIVPQTGPNSWLGSGIEPREQVSAVPILELPTAPVGSLAGFANMRINPGWHSTSGYNFAPEGSTWDSTLSFGKRNYYQSGITGPGIGNSFAHPMIPGSSIYRFLDNSKSQDLTAPNGPIVQRDHKAFCDYWDHTFLINDGLWDDYFMSSFATGGGDGGTADARIEECYRTGQAPPNSRLVPHVGDDGSAARVIADLQSGEGYLKAAAHLLVDGAFNVNSTSVAAWETLFRGIRSNPPTFRNRGSHGIIRAPEGAIAISRMNTATSDKECVDPEAGVLRADGLSAWTGVRFIDDDQIRRLARECVAQVKRRGPFLNMAEFVNRRLSDDDLGRLGTLQAAIDYDDDSPESGSINHPFKQSREDLITESDLGEHLFQNPEAATGSRFAGIPGYVIQSDLLKPLGNTLTVRDDTFRIRAYGEKVDDDGRVIARAWCEAIVQRFPEYLDPSDEPELGAGRLTNRGTFAENGELSEINRRFGRRLSIVSFRWLHPDEV